MGRGEGGGGREGVYNWKFMVCMYIQQSLDHNLRELQT